MYNVLDYPIACLPVTRVDATKDSHLSAPAGAEGHEEERRAWDRWNADEELAKCSRLVRREVYKAYDAGKMQGLPVGLQVVCPRPFRSLEGTNSVAQITPPGKEERALGMMKMLDDALPGVKVRGGSWVDRKSREKRVGFGML